MTDRLLTRDGWEPQEKAYLNSKGQPCISHQERCGRCGGRGGSERWAYTGWTCYDCDGTGLGSITIYRLYTEVQLQKLNISKAKRDATLAAKQAKTEATRLEILAAKQAEFLPTVVELFNEALSLCGEAGFVADVIKTATDKAFLSDRQREVIEQSIAKAKASKLVEYLGVIGERSEFTGWIKMVRSFDTQFGTKYLFIIENPVGVVKYMGTSHLGQEGEQILFKARVDAHVEYQGVKQTVVSRPKILEPVCVA